MSISDMLDFCAGNHPSPHFIRRPNQAQYTRHPGIHPTFLHANHAITPLNNNRYAGNKTYNKSCPKQMLSAKTEDTTPNIHEIVRSEAGSRHAFIIVGIASNASASIANIVVTQASSDQ
jgi:hypothetical protein